MPDHNFRCGDILLCTGKYYAEQLNIVGMHGVVMGTKPHHIHVWFEPKKRSFWLTYDLLTKLETAELSPLEEHIQFIVSMLNAEEWELEETQDRYKLLCYVDELTLETLQELKSYLDIDYRGLTLGPEGMGRMITTVQWVKDDSREQKTNQRW